MYSSSNEAASDHSGAVLHVWRTATITKIDVPTPHATHIPNMPTPATHSSSAASAKPAKVGGIESQRFVMTSTDGKKGLDAVMTPHKGATWFFKMSGDAAAVAANGAALVAFLAESQLP